MAKPIPRLTPAQIAAVIETAWHDRPPFDAVLMRHGLGEGELVQLLRRELAPAAYKLWARRLNPVGPHRRGSGRRKTKGVGGA